jgi:mannosyltransferase
MPTVVTVHDFIYEKRVSGLASFVNAYQIRKAIKIADSIICISNATRQDLLCLMPEIDERRIEVVYHGVDHATFNNVVVIGDTNAQFSDCVMFVGKRAGYKNFALAVSVLAELNDLRLLVIGEQLTTDEQEYLTKYLGSRWVSMDGINNRDLANLYRYCFCLIYPSDYEGFGMPVLEAMACGCPVITSSAEALVEIGGSASLKADNSHIDSYVDKVAAILQNRDMIVASGFEHVKSFSWDLTAQKMSKIYRLYS